MEYNKILYMLLICKLYLLTNNIAKTEKLTNYPCNKVKIGKTWYDKEIFWTHLGKPYNLNFHKASNTLFFSYSTVEAYPDIDFLLGYYNMNTMKYQNIEGIKGGCSVAIDQIYDEIYLGGSDGIYKFNSLTKFADLYKESGKNIWSLFYKRTLFYVSYPDQKLNIEFEEKFVKVKEFENIEIDHFHISSNSDNIYFANKTGFYKYNTDRMVAETVIGHVVVRQIVEDNEQNTYVCTNVGIFIEDKKGFKKIIDYKNVYGLAFDFDNNIIYSDERDIIRLKYTVDGCVH